MIQTGLDISGPVSVGIRPESIHIDAEIPVSVSWVENLGSQFLLGVKAGSLFLIVLSSKRPDSDSLGLRIDPSDIHVFDKNTGENLGRRRHSGAVLS